MTDFNQIVAKILTDLAELPDRTSPEDQLDMLLVTADEIAAALREAHAAGVATRTAIGFDTRVCLNCSHIGDPPDPPALSCCPERWTFPFRELVDAYRARNDAYAAGVAAERERCAVITRHGVKFTPEPAKASQTYINETCRVLEAAIRAGQPLPEATS